MRRQHAGRPVAANTATVSSVTGELLRELAGWSEGPCVSIYLPLDRTQRGFGPDRLALKDAANEARRQLTAASTLRRPAIDGLLAPAETVLTGARSASGHRATGFFAAPGRSWRVDLDVDVPSISMVTDRFVITPLVAALVHGERFHVLALSQNHVRLYRGDHDGLADVTVPGMPASLASALWYEDHERQLNVHGGSHLGVDRITGTVHGSPSDRDLRRRQLVRFFRIVDTAVTKAVGTPARPLFVAGVGYELAVYLEASRYPHLAGMIDLGNPDNLTMSELHGKVWPAVSHELDAPRREVLERIRSSSAPPLILMSDILDACGEGRVAALLARPDRLVWGPPDASTVHADRAAGDVDLVSVVVGAALDQGADVYPAAEDELPGDEPVAALLRF